MSRPSPARDAILRFLLAGEAARRGDPKAIRPTYQKKAKQTESLYGVAKATGLSFAWVHEVVSQLVERGLVASEPTLQVCDAEGLFQWWSQVRTPPRIRSFHVTRDDEMVRMLQTAGVRYAITTYHAENWYQGQLFARRMDLYIPKYAFDLARRTLLDNGALLGGSNFRLWTGDDRVVEEVVKQRTEEGYRRFAPLPQVIIDLMLEDGSAAEAAELLLERTYGHAHPHLR